MQRTRHAPEAIALAGLVAIAAILFMRVGVLPDYSPDRTTSVATPPSRRGPTPVQDFAYIFNYARSAAAERDVSPYSVAAHRRFLTRWLGPHVQSALCFAYTPTLVLLLAPMFPLPTTWAWLAWNVIGAAVAASGIRLTALADRRAATFASAAIAGPAAFYCFALGQTALLTLGLSTLTVFLAGRSVGGARAAWPAAACLFALTIKPPLALVAAAALCAAGLWRPLMLATAAALATMLAAIAWWNVEMLRDYLALVAHYDLVNAAPLFRMGFHPEVMSNLRNVLLHTGRFDDGAASGISWYPFAAGLALPVLVRTATKRALPVETAAAWAAVMYLLFSPHLTPTEDLLLVAVMLWLWPGIGTVERKWVAAICVGLQFFGGSTAALLLRLDLGTSIAPGVPLIAFGLKLAVAVVAGRALVAAASRPATARARLLGTRAGP